jgi:hypothetical protein
LQRLTDIYGDFQKSLGTSVTQGFIEGKCDGIIFCLRTVILYGSLTAMRNVDFMGFGLV